MTGFLLGIIFGLIIGIGIMKAGRSTSEIMADHLEIVLTRLARMQVLFTQMASGRAQAGIIEEANEAAREFADSIEEMRDKLRT
jgi:hypothetical protein